MPRARPAIQWLTQRVRALGDPTRLRMVGFLSRRPHYGEELADYLELSPATVSHHLRILREAGLVDTHRQSRHVLFVLDSPSLEETTDALRPDSLLDALLELPSEAALAERTVEKWLDDEGQIVDLPKGRTARATVLRWAAGHLATDRLYPERELRLVLLRIARDPEALERALVQQKWLQRAGTVYRRVEEVDAL